MSNARHGFTLIELAIVLVIVGLLLAGVLVGQDLINAARIRGVITDIERYNAAATTFQTKYDGLPGDLINTRAFKFGFNTARNDAARNGTANHGDGDGKIKGCSLAWGANALGCETVLFWADLGNAHLINFKSGLTSITATNQIGRAPFQVVDDNIAPKARIQEQLSVMVFNSDDGQNKFAIGHFYTDSGGGVYNTIAGNWSTAKGLTPMQAEAMDRKMDDGEPLTGSVHTLGATLSEATDTTLGNATNCTSAAGHYNTVTETAASKQACVISMRSAF